MEDFVDDFGDEWEDFRSERDVKASIRPFYNTGYREGVEKGKEDEAALQVGFDFGIQTTLSPAYMFGLLKGYIIIATQVVKYLDNMRKDGSSAASGTWAFDSFLESGNRLLQELHKDLQTIESSDRTSALSELALQHVATHPYTGEDTEDLGPSRTDIAPASSRSETSSGLDTDEDIVDPLLREEHVRYFVQHVTPDVLDVFRQRLQASIDLFVQLEEQASSPSKHQVEDASMPRGYPFLSNSGLVSVCQEALSMFDRIQSFL